MVIIRFFTLLLLIFFNFSLYAQEKFFPPKTPWHLADIWWEAKAPIENFQELSVDFEIIGEPKEDTLLYIAPVGLSRLNGIAFYGGIQTSVSGWKNKEDKILLKLGKGGIFSRWSADEKPISLDYAKGDKKTYYHSAGYEGEFVSVRTKFEWSEGKYQYRLKKLNTEQKKEGVFTWFGAYVYEYTSKKEYFIGALRFQGDSFIYGKKHAAFVEVYGTLNRSEIPQVTVIFEEPRINNKPFNPLHSRVSYPQLNKKSESNPQFSYTQIGKDKVVVMSIPSGLNAIK